MSERMKIQAKVSGALVTRYVHRFIGEDEAGPKPRSAYLAEAKAEAANHIRILEAQGPMSETVATWVRNGTLAAMYAKHAAARLAQRKWPPAAHAAQAQFVESAGRCFEVAAAIVQAEREGRELARAYLAGELPLSDFEERITPCELRDTSPSRVLH
jgi:hypothetical protein